MDPLVIVMCCLGVGAVILVWKYSPKNKPPERPDQSDQ